MLFGRSHSLTSPPRSLNQGQWASAHRRSMLIAASMRGMWSAALLTPITKPGTWKRSTCEAENPPETMLTMSDNFDPAQYALFDATNQMRFPFRISFVRGRALWLNPTVGREPIGFPVRTTLHVEAVKVNCFR